MPKYAELRPLFTRSREEKVVIMRCEILAALDQMQQLLARLVQVDANQLTGLYRGRFSELLEIVTDSHTTVRQLSEAIPQVPQPINAEELRTLRHDLLGPVGTLRGSILVLNRSDLGAISGLPSGCASWVPELLELATDMKDIIDALTQEQEREA